MMQKAALSASLPDILRFQIIFWITTTYASLHYKRVMIRLCALVVNIIGLLDDSNIVLRSFGHGDKSIEDLSGNPIDKRRQRNPKTKENNTSIAISQTIYK